MRDSVRFICTLLAACLLSAGIAAAQTPSIRDFNLPSQPLAASLRDVGAQAHLNVFFDAPKVEGKIAPAIRMTGTTDEALAALLRPSGLKHRFLNENTVVLAGAKEAKSELIRSEGSEEFPVKNSAVNGPVESSPSDAPVSSDHAASGTEGADLEKRIPRGTESRGEGVEEVVVTGTHIRGTSPITSPIIQLDRAAIERSGYVNTDEFVRSLPQAFAGGGQGASPDGNLGPGANATNNVVHAVAVNLNGLGENATLTLLNGHRLAASAYGNVVDISQIPLAAIERIDVLTDGASAIYGADAAAGVVNIILRKNIDGAETRAAYRGVSSGGLRNELLDQTLGRVWSSGSVTASFAYNRQTSLSGRDRDFTFTAPQPTNIMNPYKRASLVITGDQKISEKIAAYGDALAVWGTSRDLITLEEGVTVDAFSSAPSLSVHGGLRYAISDSWSIDFSSTYSDQANNVGFDQYFFPITFGKYVTFYDDRIRSVDLSVNGGLMTLPAGEIKVALGASYRDEDAANRHGDSSIGKDVAVQRRVNARFAELSIPIVSPLQEVRFISQLLFSVAVRQDDYSDFGSTTNPKIGMLWSISPSISVKANWGRSFRPPSAGELIFSSNTGNSLVNYPFDNPEGGAPIPTFILSGANPNLEPETSDNFNAGLDISPVQIPGLKLSLNYFTVDFSNRIVRAPTDTGALIHPEIYGSLITRVPTDSAAETYLSGFLENGGKFIDLLGTGATGVRAIYNGQLTNAATVKQSGFSVYGGYEFSTAGNEFLVGLNIARINKIDTQFSRTAITTDLSNTYGNPHRLRIRAEAAWKRGAFEASSAINFANAYSDTSTTPSGRASSYTTIDLSAGWDFSGSLATTIFADSSIRLNGTNILDRSPPFVEGTGLTGVHYDVGNASPLGRVLTLELQKRW